MQDNDVPQRLEWQSSPLYRELWNTFPTYRTRQQGVLDVENLAKAIGMTTEGLYKWFRAKRILSRKGLEKLIELANQPENVAALKEAGREPPTKEEFARLMLS